MRWWHNCGQRVLRWTLTTRRTRMGDLHIFATQKEIESNCGNPLEQIW